MKLKSLALSLSFAMISTSVSANAAEKTLPQFQCRAVAFKFRVVNGDFVVEPNSSGAGSQTDSVKFSPITVSEVAPFIGTIADPAKHTVKFPNLPYYVTLSLMSWKSTSEPASIGTTDDYVLSMGWNIHTMPQLVLDPSNVTGSANITMPNTSTPIQEKLTEVSGSSNLWTGADSLYAFSVSCDALPVK